MSALAEWLLSCHTAGRIGEGEASLASIRSSARSQIVSGDADCLNVAEVRRLDRSPLRTATITPRGTIGLADRLHARLRLPARMSTSLCARDQNTPRRPMRGALGANTSIWPEPIVLLGAQLTYRCRYPSRVGSCCVSSSIGAGCVPRTLINSSDTSVRLEARQ